MKLLITVLALCTCRAAEERTAMAVLYKNSEQKGQATSLDLVGIVEFSQKGPNANLMVNINVFTDAEYFADGLHGFHIHQMGRSAYEFSKIPQTAKEITCNFIIVEMALRYTKIFGIFTASF